MTSRYLLTASLFIILLPACASQTTVEDGPEGYGPNIFINPGNDAGGPGSQDVRGPDGQDVRRVPGEDCVNCPVDPNCGDGQCGEDESCQNCAKDCGQCPKPDPLNVVIDYPPRGLATTQTQVGIQGHITGGTAPYTLTINGVPAGTDQNNQFQGEKVSVHGMNLVKAEVKDSSGNSALATHAYYYAEHYYPVDYSNPSSSMIKDGVMAFLGPEVWDDNDPSDLDDIASVIILFVQDVDLGSLIQNPVTSGDFDICDYEVDIKNVSWGAVDVDLIPVAGGLYTHIVIPKFKAEVDADLDGWACPDVGGTVKIDSIVIDVTFFVSADGNGGVTASCGPPSVSINDIDVELDNNILDFLVGWLVNWFANQYKDKVEEMFEDELKNQINGTISQTLESLAWEQSFEIPLFLGIGQPMTIKAVMSVSTVDFSPQGAIVGIQATMVSTKFVTHDVPGSISNAPCKKQSDGPFTGGAYKFEIGLYDDLLNQVPFALYWGGLFALPIPAEALAGLADLDAMGLDISELYLDLLLPPIMTDCQKEAYSAQIGDISATIDLSLMGKQVMMEIFASVEIGLAFKIVDGPNGKEIGAEVTPSKVEVDVGDVTVKDGTDQDAAALKAIVEAMIGTQLAGVFQEQIAASIPLPAIDLSGLHPMIPAGTKIKIAPKALERKWGYTVFSGDVAGVVDF